MAFDRASIFDAAFLESLKRLRIVARRVPGGGRFAEHRSQDAGGGVDFKDFRPYSPGDDFRSIDWNIYQRLGKVFLRLYEELEDLPLYILTDHSKSLYQEQPPRIVPSLRATLALASISLNHHDTVGVFPFSNDVQTLWSPQGGAGKVMHLATRLSSLEPGGSTDFAMSLKRLNSMSLRRGLLAVVSDFFDPQGIEAVTAALKTVRHRLLLIQLVRPSDRRPELNGDYHLVDCESGESAEVSVTDRLLSRYTGAYDRFQTGLTDFASKRGAGLLQLDVEQEVAPQLATLFETGGYVV